MELKRYHQRFPIQSHRQTFNRTSMELKLQTLVDAAAKDELLIEPVWN